MLNRLRILVTLTGLCVNIQSRVLALKTALRSSGIALCKCESRILFATFCHQLAKISRGGCKLETGSNEPFIKAAAKVNVFRPGSL